jgi:hypothetical protein
MTYSNIIDKISQDIQLPVEVVDKAYKAYWKFIRDSIQGLPLKDDLSEEEFNNLRTSFNIPSLGKLCCTFDNYKGTKKRFEYIRQLRKR